MSRILVSHVLHINIIYLEYKHHMSIVDSKIDENRGKVYLDFWRAGRLSLQLY